MPILKKLFFIGFLSLFVSMKAIQILSIADINAKNIEYLETTKASPYACLLLVNSSCTDAQFNSLRNGTIFLPSRHEGLEQLLKGAILLNNQDEKGAIDIWSEVPEIGNYLVFVASQSPSSNRQRQLLSYAIELYPSIAGYYNLGMIYLQDKNFAEAITKFDRALEISSREAETIYRSRILLYMGKAYFNEGKYDRARNLYYQAMEFRHDWSAPWIFLAEIDMAVGDSKSAIDRLITARDKYGDHNLLVYTLARAYYQDERYGEAIALLQNLVEENTQHKSAWLLLGNALYENEMYSQAASAYVMCLSLSPRGSSEAFISGRIREIEKTLREN